MEVYDTTDTALTQALMRAGNKFGGHITLTGNEDFRRRAAALATRLGIEVTDPDLAEIVLAERVKVNFGQRGADPLDAGVSFEDDDEEQEQRRDSRR